VNVAMMTGILGGIGIFLLGMILLTEGLKAAAGNALRAMVQRFTRGPGTALVSGAALTALVQSSSATTLTTIGFVSAGLLSFPAAVAVIFGANLGTTSTGWLVSTIGFKVSLSAVAFPLVGVGAILRLLGRGRGAHAGMALAGFGLIFVGIDVLRIGMEGLAAMVDPAAFPGATLLGRILLVGIGLVMTVVMQSSSAAVTTTLTALHTGSIGLEQAAFLVIGQNMGTTVKAALASIGGSIPVKRTALAHILFNLVTGVLGLLLLRPLLAGAIFLAGPDDPEVALAIFHSAFNLIGVLVLFPVLGRFSGTIERLIPEPEPTLTRHLHPSVAQLPPVAIEAARRSTESVARVLFERCRRVLEAGGRTPVQDPYGERRQAGEAIAQIRTFVSGLRTAPTQEDEHARHLSLLHAVDHLDGFLGALGDLEGVGVVADGGAVQGRRILDGPLDFGGGAIRDATLLEAASRQLSELRKSHRARILEATARGELDPAHAWEEIEVIKVLDRLGYHAWRAVRHLRIADADPSGENGGGEGGPADGKDEPLHQRTGHPAKDMTSELFADREDDAVERQLPAN